MLQKTAKAPLKRDSNIELFRIIAMFFIVAHHYVVNSGLNTATGPIWQDPLSAKSLFLLTWGAFGKIGINCFVMITGYFMCRSTISAKKFAKLLFELMFYRIVIYSLFLISGYSSFSLRSLVDCLIPFTSVATNFTGTYILFFLSIPFLNILVHNLTEKQHLRLIALCAFIYVFFGTIPTFSVTMNYVSWYMVVFFTASYLRLYPKALFSNVKFWAIAFAACVILCCGSVMVGAWIGVLTGIKSAHFFVADSNNLLAYLTGISSFMFFKNIRIRPSAIINTISSTTFGILMIHANSDTMRKWLWEDVLHATAMYHSDWMYLHAIVGTLVVFTACALIHLAVVYVFERPFFSIWDKHFNKISDAYERWEAKLCRKWRIGEKKS